MDVRATRKNRLVQSCRLVGQCRVARANSVVVNEPQDEEHDASNDKNVQLQQEDELEPLHGLAQIKRRKCQLIRKQFSY